MKYSLVLASCILLVVIFFSPTEGIFHRRNTWSRNSNGVFSGLVSLIKNGSEESKSSEETPEAIPNKCDRYQKCSSQGDCEKSADDHNGQYSYKCECDKGFTGHYCQYTTCHQVTCHNSGKPTVNRHSGKCECDCPTGFVGTLCQLKICDTQPCGKHGKCTAYKAGLTSQFKCQCEAGYKGDNCQTSLCADVRCGNGQCVPDGRSVKCECPKGQLGNHCEKSICDTTPCRNGRKTMSADGKSCTCSCDRTYKGDDCSLRRCENKLCGGRRRGMCVTLNSAPGYRCDCLKGYEGADCSKKTPQCPDNYCNNNGQCSIDKQGKPKCSCPAGYSGERCEMDRCTSKPGQCKNGGTCNPDPADPLCTCKPSGGYLGHTCELSVCANLQCYNGGSCTAAYNNQPYCKCVNGYTGPQCKTSPCANHDCSRHGICQITRSGVARCACYNGYGGDNCQHSLVCPANHCGPNSESCKMEQNQPVCKCKEGYYGERCETTQCGDIACQNGACINKANKVCECSSGYTGASCDKHLCNPSLSTCNNGVCLPAQTAVGYKCSSCKHGFKGNNCEISPCDPVLSTCNSGICTPANTTVGYTCSNPDIIRRIVIQANYLVECSFLSNPTTRVTLDSLAESSFTEIQSVCDKDCVREPGAEARVSCSDDKLTITWNTNKEYTGDITAIPTQLRDRLTTRLHQIPLGFLKIVVVNKQPPIVYPEKVEVVLSSSCQSNKIYDEQSDRCV